MKIANIHEVLNRIEILIARAGMTKQEFYDKTGISSASFSQWRTGMYAPSMRKLQRAADVLGVSVEYFLYGESGEGRSAKKETAPTGDAADERVALFASLAAQLKPDQQEMILRLVKDLLPPRE